MFSMPPATQALILSCVVVFLMQSLGVDGLALFALWPVGSGGFMPWQLITYAFLHGGMSHLVFNMFGLFMFGAELERVWGSKRLLVFYFVSVLVAALTQLMVAAWSGSPNPTVGASGGLFGLLVGFAMLFPHRRIVPLIPPIPMPAWLFVVIYGVIELFLGVTGSMSGVAHFAHLGGILGGWLTLRYWRGQLPFGRRR
ncbi:rhomboid family intramembrane serine protease [Variovorax guangxiensis]|uniref:Rhomboid family intramembrane serine protease n=1 Tax=Variovorax guangxiensis TaxID=1775474 RepID=A0A502DZM8_9BURK|nr:rhomboid family intramembrane serine protease [Variovorax guangxiensis]RZI65600.1 MAG: rhomboid family intramembrane serine protease [Variovorax sp.]TPG27226.1 rhomboid family intramembrane serine protease [Variovorax ginsengisoli]TPG30955.1 rhomboid family intramembrane serine protease [Variovorax guangxiensis]